MSEQDQWHELGESEQDYQNGHKGENSESGAGQPGECPHEKYKAGSASEGAYQEELDTEEQGNTPENGRESGEPESTEYPKDESESQAALAAEENVSQGQQHTEHDVSESGV
ncbi:uncharacterized protein TM35_000141780, partial [Trypanosoma theileri]